MRFRRTLLVLLAASLAGCTVDMSSPPVYFCSKDKPTCPANYRCNGGLCVPEGWLDGGTAVEAGGSCGNSAVEGGEQCDGTNLNGKTCQDLCYGGGKLTCSKSCTFVVEQCTAPTAERRIKAKGVSFFMGSEETEVGRYRYEDRHKVTLSSDFLISPTEVTQEQFTKLMGYNPSYVPSKGHPVEEVLWHEAAAYCNALSAAQGLKKCYVLDRTSCPSQLFMCKPPTEAACKKTRCDWLKVDPTFNTTVKTIYSCPGYRLPTEAEWEMAYRAGTTTATYAGDILYPGGTDPVAGKIGWYYQNSKKGSEHHPVAKKMPNAFCLFDMGGNIWEYVNDFKQNELGTSPVTDPVGPVSGAYRMLRGGAMFELARDLRAARREPVLPHRSNVNTGFRCVRTASD